MTSLEMGAKELLRTGESVYKELNLGNASITDEQALQAMLAHPVLIERPIVIVGDKATIGRPIEQVVALLEQG